MSYVCETCGKEYKTRSGLWKHQKKLKHGKFAQESRPEEPEILESKPTEPEKDVSHSSSASTTQAVGEDTFSDDEWFNFDFGESEDKTDTIPTPLKLVVNQPLDVGGKMTKAQREAFKTQNMALLKMGLTTTDLLLSKYGQDITLDKEFKVEHR